MVKRFYSLMALLCLMVLSASAQVQITATPADGSTVEKLSSITVAFSGVDEVDKGAKASSITITSDQGYSAGVTVDYGEGDTDFVVTFTEVSADGLYTIDFPAGAFEVFEPEGVEIPAFQLTYRIGEEKGSGLAVTPAAGSTVTWLTDIVLSAVDAPTKSLLTSNDAQETPYILSPSGEKLIVDGNSVWDSATGGYTYHITPRLLISEPGEYTLVIPDNYYYYYDYNPDYTEVKLPGLEAKYNVTGGELQAFTSVPSKDEPVSRFKELVVTFPDATTVESNSSQNIVLYRDVENWVASISLSYNFKFEGNQLTYTSYTDIIDAGHYTATFPEGCLLIDGEPSAPFMVEFDVVETEPLNMVITPADGASVEGILNTAVITFPDNDEVSINSGSVSLYLVDGEKTYNVGFAYGTTAIEKQDDGSFLVKFSNLATQSGTYKITVQRNLFTAGDQYNAETSTVFTYTAPEAPTMVVTPADGTTLDRVQTFTVSFPDAADEVTVNSSGGNVVLYKGRPYKGEYGVVGNTFSTVMATAITKNDEGNFTFTFTNPGIEAGEYTLAIPTALFIVGDKTFNQTDTLTYYASGEGMDKLEVTPSEPVASLKEITITFVNETAVKFQTDYSSATFYMVNPDAAWDTYKESISATENAWSGHCYIEEDKPNTVHFTLKEEYTEEGEYYIEMSNWFLFMSDETTPNTAAKVYFTIDTTTGISDVSSKGGRQNGNVYDLQGRKVNGTEKPGLYIKNGKKMLVK